MAKSSRRILNERQQAVIECLRMRLNEKQSLAYLKGLGFDVSDTTYYRDKKIVEGVKMRRLVQIAETGFQDQHIDRIDNTELALKLMWENYHLERDPYKKFQMLKDIIMIQPYLSSYYEASKLIIENRPDIIENVKNLQAEKDRLINDNFLSFTPRIADKRPQDSRPGSEDNNRKF